MMVNPILPEPVICHEKAYQIVEGPDVAGFCVLRDVEGETILEHESIIENGLRADVAWVCAEEKDENEN